MHRQLANLRANGKNGGESVSAPSQHAVSLVDLWLRAITLPKRAPAGIIENCERFARLWDGYLGWKRGSLSSVNPSTEERSRCTSQLNWALLYASGDSFVAFRAFVYELPLDDETQDTAVLVAQAFCSWLCDDGRRSDNPAPYRGLNHPLVALCRLKRSRRPYRYPKLLLIERYVQERFTVRHSQKVEQSALMMWTWWLLRRKGIPLREQPSNPAILQEAEAALRLASREDLVAFARWLLRPQSEFTLTTLRDVFRRVRQFYAALAAAGQVTNDITKMTLPIRAIDFERVRENPAKSNTVYRVVIPLPSVERFIDTLPSADLYRTQLRWYLWHYVLWFARRKNVLLHPFMSEHEISLFDAMLIEAQPADIAAYRAELTKVGAHGTPRSRMREMTHIWRYYDFLTESWSGCRNANNPAQGIKLERHDCALPAMDVDLYRKRKQLYRPKLSLYEEFRVACETLELDPIGRPELIWDFFWWVARDKGIPLIKGAPKAVLSRFRQSVLAISSSDLQRYRKDLQQRASGSEERKRLRFNMVLLFYLFLKKRRRLKKDPGARLFRWLQSKEIIKTLKSRFALWRNFEKAAACGDIPGVKDFERLHHFMHWFATRCDLQLKDPRVTRTISRLRKTLHGLSPSDVESYRRHLLRRDVKGTRAHKRSWYRIAVRFLKFAFAQGAINCDPTVGIPLSLERAA